MTDDRFDYEDDLDIYLKSVRNYEQAVYSTYQPTGQPKRSHPDIDLSFEFNDYVPSDEDENDHLSTNASDTEPPIDSSVAWREVVIDENGVPRQAGSDVQLGKYMKKLRAAAEKHLYVFAKGILGYRFLTNIHKEACEFLQTIPPFRKLLMLPRLHAKSVIVSQALPTHVLIQPRENNVYIAGIAGSDCRILLACETETMATRWLRVVKAHFEGNQLLRAFWPAVCYEHPRKEAPKWSSTEIIIQRETEYPDASIRAVGVGGAVTGARPNILIKDDLISLAAANSELVMQAAIDWHTTSRALLDEYEENTGQQSLEFIIGTHWAVWDLYTHIEENDPSVEILKRAIYETTPAGERRIIWPERWTWKRIKQLENEYGSMFPLLYLNEPFDPKLVVFNMDNVRYYEVTSDEKITFTADERDKQIYEDINRMEHPITGKDQAQPDTPHVSPKYRKTMSTAEFFDVVTSRSEYLRAKYS